MSTGQYSLVKTVITGDVITASDRNAEHQNHINNANPDGIGAHSDNATEMRTTTDPYPGGVESLATTMAGELERLRYQVAQLSGQTYWYQDPNTTIWIPAGSMIPNVSGGAPPGTTEEVLNHIMYDYLAFDGASEEYVQFNIVMPESWDRSTIKAKFYWSSASGSTAGDTVEWEISGVAISNDDALGPGVGTSQVISDTLLADNGTDMQISGATPAITIGGTPALNDFIAMRVSRNVGGTDNMTEDAWLFGVLIQIGLTNNATIW